MGGRAFQAQGVPAGAPRRDRAGEGEGLSVRDRVACWVVMRWWQPGSSLAAVAADPREVVAVSIGVVDTEREEYVGSGVFWRN